MKRKTLLFLASLGFALLIWDILVPFLGNYVRVPNLGYWGFLATVLLPVIIVTGINSLHKRVSYGDLVSSLFGGIVGVPFAIFIGFAIYPTIAAMSPQYKEASTICYSIKPGMPYEELKTKYGDKFWTPGGAGVHFDKDGNAQVSLTNDVWQLETSCHIRISNGVVTDAMMLYVWL